MMSSAGTLRPKQKHIISNRIADNLKSRDRASGEENKFEGHVILLAIAVERAFLPENAMIRTPMPSILAFSNKNSNNITSLRPRQ